MQTITASEARSSFTALLDGALVAELLDSATVDEDFSQDIAALHKAALP